MSYANSPRREVPCPYCGVLLPQPATTAKPTAAICDPEWGGCDRYFVYECKATVTYNITTAKLELTHPDHPNS